MRKEVWIQEWVTFEYGSELTARSFFLRGVGGVKENTANQIQLLSTSLSFLCSPWVPAGVTYCGQFLNIFLRSPKWSQTEVLRQIINKLLPEHNSATWGKNKRSESPTLTCENWAKVRLASIGTWPSSSWTQSLRREKAKKKKDSTWSTSDPNWRDTKTTLHRYFN